MSDKVHIDVEPRDFTTTVGKRVNQEIFFINRRSETYRNIMITLRPPWQVQLRQNKYPIGNLDPGVSKSIKVEAKATEQTDQPLQLTVHIEGKRPQKLDLNLIVLTDEPPKPGPMAPKRLPTIREFRRELLKLTDEQLGELCLDYEAFQDLYDSLFTTQESKPKRIGKIIDHCRRREKFLDLHQALKDLLQQEYTFFNQ